MKQRAAQDVERAGAILQPGDFAAPAPCRRRLMVHPFELLRADEKTDRIPRRVIFLLWRRTSLQTDDLQAGGRKLLRHDAAHAADADNTNIAPICHAHFSSLLSDSTATGSRSTGLLMNASA